MALPRFAYIKAKAVREALEYLEYFKEIEGGTVIMAGGTDLVVRIRKRLLRPNTIVDVKDILELKEISETASQAFIGATVTFSEISQSNLVHRHFPLLKEAAEQFGSPQIRNLATIGGNVRTASPAGDGLVALFGLEAEVDLVSPKRQRTLPIQDFVTGPQRTEIQPDELLKGFRIPKRSWDFQCFFKVGRRNALAIAVVNGVILLDFEGKEKRIADARIVLGAMAPTPVRLKRAEDQLKGEPYPKARGQKFQDAIKEAISPISDIRASQEYREYISRILCDRILTRATGNGGVES